MAIAIGAYIWDRTAERRAIVQLDAEERAAIYLKNMEGFTQLCAAPTPLALEERCRNQARFLMLFPECTESCRKATSRFITASTR